jgi:hypothetical protein
VDFFKKRKFLKELEDRDSHSRCIYWNGWTQVDRHHSTEDRPRKKKIFSGGQMDLVEELPSPGVDKCACLVPLQEWMDEPIADEPAKAKQRPFDIFSPIHSILKNDLPHDPHKFQLRSYSALMEQFIPQAYY